MHRKHLLILLKDEVNRHVHIEWYYLRNKLFVRKKVVRNFARRFAHSHQPSRRLQTDGPGNCLGKFVTIVIYKKEKTKMLQMTKSKHI